MIRLPAIEVLSPTTLRELTETLAASNGETRVLAGGTDLVVNMKQGVVKPARVVWLGKLGELRDLTVTREGSLAIGAMCTLAEIAAAPLVRDMFPSLAQAALSVASPAIRNTGTLGGNLCLETRCCFFNQSEFWRSAIGGCLRLGTPSAKALTVCHAAPGLTECTAISSSDTAPILIALDARVRLLSSRGEREISLAELYCNDGINHLSLERGEIVAQIVIPVRRGRHAVHLKIRARESVDFAVANVGVSLAVDSSGVCEDVRIIVGAIQSAPVRVLDAEAVVLHTRVTRDKIEQAAERAVASLTPLPHVAESVGYRKRMIGVLVTRAFEALTGSG